MIEYISTDLHFGHELMFKTGRPANYEQLLWNQFDIINKQHGKDAIVYILGDIAFGNYHDNFGKKFAKYSFRKILIIGNHDKRSRKWYMENGWDLAVHSLNIKFMGYNIVFSHMPIAHNYDINIHGHFHDIPIKSINKFEPNLIDLVKSRPNKYYLISPEAFNYKIYTLRTIINMINKNKLLNTYDTIRK